MLSASLIVFASVFHFSFKRDRKLKRFFFIKLFNHFKKIFFLSAQGLSVLFHLRKFCSVAKLLFKCLPCLPRKKSFET